VKVDPTFWLVARSTGITAYVLVTASVLAGLVVKSRPFGSAVKTADAVDLHRALAFLGLGMLALHGAALVLDQTVRMPVAALVVPFDAGATREAIARLLADAGLRDRLGAAAREVARSITWDAVVERQLEIYRAAIARA